MIFKESAHQPQSAMFTGSATSMVETPKTQTKPANRRSRRRAIDVADRGRDSRRRKKSASTAFRMKFSGADAQERERCIAAGNLRRAGN